MVGEGGGVVILGEESDGTRLQRLYDGVLGAKAGERDEPRRAGPGCVAADRLDAVDTAHLEVHENHVGPVASDGVEDLVAVVCLTDHVDPLGNEDAADHGAGERVVIHDEYLGHGPTVSAGTGASGACGGAVAGT